MIVRFSPDSRGKSVAHIGKVVPSPNESVSQDSNTRFHPYGDCSPLTSYQFNQVPIGDVFNFSKKKKELNKIVGDIGNICSYIIPVTRLILY